jgi:hypothetical protein
MPARVRLVNLKRPFPECPGLAYFAAFNAAQRFFCASAIFRFVAALKDLRFLIGATGLASGAASGTAVAAVTTGFCGGRPRRFAGDPWRASMAPAGFSRKEDLVACRIRR